MKSAKPWLNSDGKTKSDEELKQISKNWTPSEWEEYLTSLEKRRREPLLHIPSDINEAIEDYVIFMFSEQSRFPHLLEAFDLAMETLTPREHQILRKKYWEGMSEYLIAHELKLSRSSVQTLKSRGLNKIKKILQSGYITRHFESQGQDLGLNSSSVCHPKIAIYREQRVLKRNSATRCSPKLEKKT